MIHDNTDNTMTPACLGLQMILGLALDSFGVWMDLDLPISHNETSKSDAGADHFGPRAATRHGEAPASV